MALAAVDRVGGAVSLCSQWSNPIVFVALAGSFFFGPLGQSTNTCFTELGVYKSEYLHQRTKYPS
jgi:hypothetical protein